MLWMEAHTAAREWLGPVAQVGIALQEPRRGDLTLVRAVVPQHVEPVPDVHDVDQAILDDRITPHDDVVGTRAERRVLRGHGTQWFRDEGRQLRGSSRVAGGEQLESRAVPGDEGQVFGDRGIVRGEARTHVPIPAHLVAVRLLVVRRHPILRDDVGTALVGHVDQMDPAPGTPLVWPGPPVDLVRGEHQVAPGNLHRTVRSRPVNGVTKRMSGAGSPFATSDVSSTKNPPVRKARYARDPSGDTEREWRSSLNPGSGNAVDHEAISRNTPSRAVEMSVTRRSTPK